MTLPVYRPRRTGSLGVRTRAGWTIKLIGIAAGPDLPERAEVDAALRCAENLRPASARPGAGFLIVHRGTEAEWGILGWWDLDILHLRFVRAPLGTGHFRPVAGDESAACVWELSAIEYERRAWVEHVLQRPADPDLAGYLASTLTVAG